jgi:hydroxymethylpyrimidine pyrophosphatase-like HAD family hydrolase
MSKQKIIAFDLDDVLCHRSNQFENLGPLKYSYCIPNKKMIELVNSLYDDGHKIVIYTARGMTQFNGNVIEIYGQLYTKTLKNLDEWGLKYHQLVMGKIHYDVLIDDKVLNSLNITKDSITQFLYGK